MAKPVALLASDLHLEPYAWKHHPSLRGDAYFALEQIVRHALHQQVLGVALLGDLFDVRRPDPHTVAEACRRFTWLQEAGIAVWYLQGQHDLSRDTPWLGVHEWPIHIHRREVAIGSINAYGLDWSPPNAIQEELNNVPLQADLLLAHQVWADFYGGLFSGECSFTDVPASVRMLVTGDYHRHFVVQAANRGGRPLIVGSPGSTCLQAIDEEGEKAVFLLKDDLSLERVPLQARRIHRHTVNTPAELDALLEPGSIERLTAVQGDVPEHIAVNIVYVAYNDEIPEAYAKLTRAFKGKAHFFPKPMRAGQMPGLVDLPAMQEAGGVLEKFLASLAPKESVLYRDLLTLLGSLDADQAIKDVRTAFDRRFEAQTASRSCTLEQ